MKSYTGKQLIRLLRKHGWQVVRVEGSHHILTHAEREEIMSVPVHGSKTLKTGMIAGILKTARLSSE